MAIRLRSQAGDRLPQGSGNRRNSSGNVRRKVLVSRNWSQQTAKNEPVVGRNIHHGARPCLEAKLTPWVWAGGTKEVGTRWVTGGDPGRYGRCAAIEVRGIQRPYRSEVTTFCFVYPKHLYSRTRYTEMLISKAHSEIVLR